MTKKQKINEAKAIMQRLIREADGLMRNFDTGIESHGHLYTAYCSLHNAVATAKLTKGKKR